VKSEKFDPEEDDIFIERDLFRRLKIAVTSAFRLGAIKPSKNN
jgi:hypothetical protein